MSLTDKQLDVLHDHYKETFARIHEEEKSRDRHFLALIGLFALLCLEIGYPAALGGSLGTAHILGGELHLDALPLPALLNLTWTLTLVITLKYCRITVWVSRQYPYLHALEEHISGEMGGGNLYRREGKVYLTDYPLLLDVSWFIYSVLFSLIIIGATILLAVWEWQGLEYPALHRFFDVVIAITIIGIMLLYRVEPYIASKSKRWRSFKTRKQEKQSSETTAVTSGQESPINRGPKI